MKFVQGGQAATAAKSASRSVAKDRLSVILASQRGSELLDGVCMEDLQRDVMEVVEVSVNFPQLNLVCVVSEGTNLTPPCLSSAIFRLLRIVQSSSMLTAKRTSAYLRYGLLVPIPPAIAPLFLTRFAIANSNNRCQSNYQLRDEPWEKGLLHHPVND